MNSLWRKFVTLVGVSSLLLWAGLPAPEFDNIPGNENNGTGIYADNARKHEIGTKLKAQLYAGADFHYDTNVLLRNTNEESSFISAGIVGGRLLFEDPRLTASLLGQINAKAYSGFGELAGFTGFADAHGEYSISDSTKVNAGDMFEYAQDPVDIISDVRAERWTNTTFGAFTTKGASWEMNLGADVVVLDYVESRYRSSDVIELKGIAEAAFDMPFGTGTLGIKEGRGFVRVTADNYTHQSKGLNDPFFIEGLLGFRGKWQTKMQWDLGFGAGSVTVDEKPSNPADQDQMVYFAFDGQIQYLATETTRVVLSGSRHGEASQFCNYSLTTRVALSVYHRFAERFDADAMVGYQYAQFSIVDSNLVREHAQIRVGYIVRQGVGMPDVRVYADYAFTNRDGDQTTSEYQDHRVGGGVAAVF